MSSQPLPKDVKPCTVTELTRQVKKLLEGTFASVWVEGELINVTRASSGHFYLTLKDAGAQVRCVIWRSTALRLTFEPADGMQAIVRGQLNVYPPRGEYQLVIDNLYPKGIGAQDLALRQLREKLDKLGYFARERKKPLPAFPTRIALVTSPTGAAVRDMLEILGRRWPPARVLICPVRVQGDGAPQSIAYGIRLVNRFRGAEVIILGRGGGSSADLAAFNTDIVAKAVFESRIPIVSAVGHEIDVTIADLVADRRALTPSEAAELVVPDRQQLLGELDQRTERLTELLTRRWQAARQRLDDLAARPAFRLPLERVRDLERRLDDTDQRLARGAQQRLLQMRGQMDAWSARLNALSPLNVLARGYSLTRRENDQFVVRRAEDVRPGDRLVTLVQHGSIVSRVEEQ